jgi:predicted transposase YbfD/YdcC
VPKKIVKAIRKSKADYVIGLKCNQENLYNAAQEFFENEDVERQEIVTHNTGHGRDETRKYSLVIGLERLPQIEEWAGLKAFGCVKSTIYENGKLREENRFFITSLTDVVDFEKAARGHWCIENSLHWRLDVIFREDESRTRRGNSAANLAVIRHIAFNALILHHSDISMECKQRKCLYKPDFLLEVIACLR